jgi:SAM-dependent methyltransferase
MPPSHASQQHPCPLCGHAPANWFNANADRTFYRCPRCALIFVDRGDRLPPTEEKARYDLHENQPDDPGYREFLRQLQDPLMARLGPPPLEGLDYGSGPTPVLAMMLSEAGYAMAVYDPFYAPDPAPLERAYDFITCTEAIEHFYRPDTEWRLLLSLLRPGGWLGLTTRLVDRPGRFMDLHFRKDRTHVCFFSRRTFNFLAEQDALQMTFIGERVVLVRKPAPPTGG